MTTRIALIDEALVLNGSEPLGSEQADGAETHIACFTRASELILTCHPWACCTFTRELNRLTAAPDTKWLYAFETPSDMLGAPRAVYDSATAAVPFTGYELFGDRQLRTNADRIWLRFTKAVAPMFWPGYLREVIVLLMRSELALSVREDRVMRDKLREDAIGTAASAMQGGLLAAARGIDDMAKPSPVIGAGANPVTGVRMAGSWYGE